MICLFLIRRLVTDAFGNARIIFGNLRNTSVVSRSGDLQQSSEKFW